MFGDNNDFTVQEKIILHLSNYNGFREHFLSPESVTQEGIAGAVGIARNHVPRAISELKREELINELKGRVKGSDRRKKVYFLSENGIRNVRGLKERLRMRESSSENIPEAYGFLGREGELREAKGALGTGKVVLVNGAEGIGKTYLASRLAQETSRTMPVLWYNVPENGGLHHLLRSMSEFLTIGGNGLLGYRLGAASALKNDELMALLIKMMTNCMVVIDDLHNADEGMNRFIEMLVKDIGRFEGLRLLLVSERSVPASKKILRIKLAGLDRPSVRKILQDRGVGDLDKTCELVESNPLFLNLIRPDAGPKAGLEEFLEVEYARMLPEERRAMWAISLHSHPVDLELLSAVDNVDYQVIVNLAGKGLIQETETTFDSHKILKEFFYSKMSPQERKRMHLKAAGALSKNDDAASWLKAQDHLLRAGARSDCARSIVRNGVRIIRKGMRKEVEAILGGLDLDELDELLRAEILLLKGYLAKLRGEWEDALGDYKKALDIFDSHKSEKKADALAKIGRVYLEQGKFDTASEYFNKGLEGLGKEPNTIRARIFDEMATIHLRKREIEEARAKVGMAMEQAKGDEELQARIHNTIGNLHMTLGEMQEAKKHYELSLEGLKDVDEQMAIVLCNNLAIIEFKSGNVEKAIELWELAAGKAEAMKNLNVMLTFSNLGSIYFSIGNWSRAAECCNNALEISEMVGKHMVTAACKSTLGHIALYRGEPEWLGNYEAALELRTKLGDKSGQASSHNDIARGWVLQENWKEAEIHAQAALTLSRETNDMEQLVRSNLSLANVSGAEKDNVKAKELLKIALVKSKEIKNNELLGQTYRGIGLLSAREGEDFVAERYLKESVETLENMRRPLLLAQSLFDYARVLKESGLGESEQILKRSSEIFKSLGLSEKTVLA